MIDIEVANKAFDNYVSNYDLNNPKIILKVEHTKRVQLEARNMAKNIGLNEEEIDLAELIGLLHDIGRFEQLKQYDTYVDLDSIDHADLGVQILFQDNFIRDFVTDTKYDSVIYKAIKEHNKFEISEGLNEQEMLHAKLIRDADKLDILNLMRNKPFNLFMNINSYEDLCNEKITDEIYEDFMEGRLIRRGKQKTNMDRWLISLAFTFDFNFVYSLEQLKQRGYIHELVARIDYKDPVTKERMNKIEAKINDYIDKRIEEN